MSRETVEFAPFPVKKFTILYYVKMVLLDANPFWTFPILVYNPLRSHESFPTSDDPTNPATNLNMPYDPLFHMY